MRETDGLFQSEILIELGNGFHSFVELGEEIALVRGVDEVTFETEAHQERIGVESTLHFRQDGDAAAATAWYRFNAIDFPDSP